jgi:hypothetical protein
MAAALGAALIVTAPAGAQQRLGTISHHRFSQTSPDHGRPGDRRFHRGFDGNAAVAWGNYDLQSSYDDRDWEPQAGNDWWHDRPDRAFPRWVQEQQARGTCDLDRMWWSGSGWHC